MDKSEREKILIRYLLGQMPSEERDTLEDQYLADDDRLEELICAESDLIDSYVRGTLSPSDRELFERTFLTPERRERVDFARALLEYPNPDAAERKHHRTVWLAATRLAVASLCLAGLGTVVWLAISNTRLSREVARQQQEQHRLQQAVADLEAKGQGSIPSNGRQQELPSLDRPGSSMISMVLAPLTRGQNQSNTVALSPGLNSISFFLNRPRETYAGYDVVLETSEGTQLQVKRSLETVPAADGKKVVVEFPAKSLSSDDYVLRLFGTGAEGREELSTYSFRIVKMTLRTR